jgi:hypothetical protein
MWSLVYVNCLGLVWAGHVPRAGEGRGFGVGKVREIDHLEDPGVYWMIILRRIFKKWYGGTWTGSIWFRIRTGGGLL